jgi:hypothetical protein
MDAQRLDEMSDAALDRDLQALLGVGPSADFAARVRTRIADEPARSRSWFGAWWFALPAAALAVMAIVAVVSRDTRPSHRNVAAPEARASISDVARSAERTNPAARPEPAPPIRRPDSGTSRNAAVAREPNGSGEPSQPEVLVDPREAAALRAVILGANDGRIDLAPVVAAAPPPVMELPPVVDIEIPAITIEPIAPGTGEEGVRQ